MRSIRAGARVGFSWTISFPLDRRNNVPDFWAEVYLPPPSWAELTSALLANASTPLAGSFGLAYGPFCEVADIVVGDGADDVRRKLQQLPGLRGELPPLPREWMHAATASNRLAGPLLQRTPVLLPCNPADCVWLCY